MPTSDYQLVRKTGVFIFKFFPNSENIGLKMKMAPGCGGHFQYKKESNPLQS
jgi:hypothetical protein